ncbi:uncharacterized protein BJ171DRAFT_624594 [Polychytrium aggregatum]|uniref:uncharacterized protein n=1 Tax=Polychytrium aggregatum TaxID=110093 RepID=UPI0022FF3244|nr:uncharacterized protein BJ171DRAFT_624594 [Polychytrium aggregatum]KAI9188501.1 hypothetical protein BJ171DRAFT_624594 [Polychytrium aggregatum]
MAADPTYLNVVYNGNVDILPGSSTVDYGLGDLTIANVVRIGSTTAATSTANSGALSVAGGIYAGNDSYFNGRLTINTTDSVSALTINGGSVFNGVISITDTTNATSYTTGGFKTAGGLSVQQDAWINRLFTTQITSTGTVTITDTTPGTSTAGALVVSGGISAGGSTYLGSTLEVASTVTLDSTTDSTNTTSGALIVAGGIGCAQTVTTQKLGVTGLSTLNNLNAWGNVQFTGSTFTASNAVSFTNTTASTNPSTGALVVSGGIGVGDNSSFAGIISLTNTTDSTNLTSGALQVAGGAEITKNLNVGGNVNVSGNTTVQGNLTVLGASTTITSQTLTVNDNWILLNAAPASLSDVGIVMQRYQTDSETGAGDVTNATPDISATAQGSTSSTTITLAASDTAATDYYKNWWIRIMSGTGAGGIRQITGFDATTKIATVETAWVTQPDNTSVYGLYYKTYAVSAWIETTDEFQVGFTPNDPTYHSKAGLISRGTFHAKKLIADDSVQTDAVNELTPGAGVTINGAVNISTSGAVTGINSINGNTVPVTSDIAMKDDGTTPSSSTVISGTTTHGSYMILVRDNVSSGAAATFIMSARSGISGTVQRLSSAKGSNGESLEITWPANGQPTLGFQTLVNSPSGATITYHVQVLSV